MAGERQEMATARTMTGSRRPSGRSARVRWDRLGRLAMLFVLVVLLYLYISPVRSLISAIHQSAADRAQVGSLERTKDRLLAERVALKSAGTLEIDARGQGLVKPGEKQFVVFGLPNN